jgi:hypothetical protein
MNTRMYSKIFSAFCLGSARERVKISVFVSSVSAVNSAVASIMLPASYGLSIREIRWQACLVISSMSGGRHCGDIGCCLPTRLHVSAQRTNCNTTVSSLCAVFANLYTLQLNSFYKPSGFWGREEDRFETGNTWSGTYPSCRNWRRYSARGKQAVCERWFRR